eukprot:TRINITY_DN28317_c0_g1_i1.p1 TRINITY_DN28317_c0_g1~~TRINITY_DN28317_c0_g1_i1.p1  ORF type:complete len:822 (+),score=388.53 TRINITY_DN28317_c0_g1_i1:76-2541(+)
MGELWRSEEMQLVQLFVQIDAAHDTVDELGKLEVIQFRDLNPDVSPFQRNFVNEVKRADEMERKIRFFEEEVAKEKKEAEREKRRWGDRDDNGIVKLEDGKEDVDARKTIDELETHFEELEKELSQMNNNQEMLNRNFNELIELRHVLHKDSSFFDESADFREGADDVSDSFNKPLVERGLEPTTTRAVKLGFVTGVVLRDKFIAFERVLWRVLRGNLFMKHAEIEEKIKEPSSGEMVEKNVFIIFFQGERSQQKIKKICESFNANLYPIPETPRERKELLNQVNGRIDDLQKVLEKTKKHRQTVLLEVGKHLRTWRDRVVREKSIYHTMNMFNYDIGRKLLIAEGWCAKNSTEKIVNAMRQATETSGALVPSVLSVIQTNEEPPTHFRTNKFTSTFQGIVESYGIAQYREVNPAPFTIITFPFLFAVMFGDFGHGILMTLFAGYLIYKEKEFEKTNLNELIRMCFGGRYLLILMGIFSMYTGLLYNECFSIPIDIFGTNWTYPEDYGNATIIPATRIDPHRTYEFGVDPAWKGSTNALTFYNSLKMKMSIIFGVTQMSLGIFLSLVNGLHFRKPVNIFAEFLPQILFFWSIFGYMVFLIVYKWCQPWTGASPPFLLNVMISMFLHPYGIEPENQVFNGQLSVQIVCIVIAVISVPWMLLIKPYVLKHQHKMKALQNPGSLVEEHDDHDHHGGGEFDFGEIFVKQIIHTIEFVLGAISNTASYLRLWALSLAHAELSEVFWERVLMQTFAISGGAQIPAVFIGFGAWFGATIGVLMIMESLSAFLHALRLHWVEFQNKFYHGDGHKFIPFSYKHLEGADDE